MQAVTDSVMLKLSHTGKAVRSHTIEARRILRSPMPCNLMYSFKLECILAVARAAQAAMFAYRGLSSCEQEGGRVVTVEPGLIGGEVNRLLDPSSIDSCMIGGIVSNNSSGMCCGVKQASNPAFLFNLPVSKSMWALYTK